MNLPQLIPAGTIATLHTKRKNGIRPMIEVLSDDGKTWVKYRGAFGGYRVKRTRRTRIASMTLP